MKVKQFGFILFFILCASLLPLSAQAQDDKSQQTITQEKEKADNLIDNSPILTHWMNTSTGIGVGTVLDVTSKFEKVGMGQTIFSYAEICVDLPLASGLRSKQTVTARYLGGQVGDIGLTVTIDWFIPSNDTIVPPSVFKLSKGQSVMFFVNETTNNLNGYIPYTSMISTQASDKLLLPLVFDPQPSSAVAESANYGFGTSGWHIDWGSLPWIYQIDPDGTTDVPGALEFDAIRAAFSTWENAPYCGVSFQEGTMYDPGDGWYDYYASDGRNSIGWVTDWNGDYPNAIALTWTWTEDSVITETDTAFNDFNKNWAIGSDLFCFDVQNLATHEIGHWLDLSDLYDSSNTDETMFWLDGGSNIEKRSLEWGDLNGAHYLYPEHNDAGSDYDAGNSFGEATYVNRDTVYSGRLCRLPSQTDADDYYKFYATEKACISILLFMEGNANFDLELYDPNGNWVDSASSGPGIPITINRDPLGSSGFWVVRIFGPDQGKEGNGGYSFQIYTHGQTKYVWSCAGYGGLSGAGEAWNPDGMNGASPNNDWAALAAYWEGDAAYISGYLNEDVSGTSDIYIYGFAPAGYTSEIGVWVSTDNYNWQNVGYNYLWGDGTPTTVHMPTTDLSYRYVIVCIWAGWQGPGCAYIDCINVET